MHENEEGLFEYVEMQGSGMEMQLRTVEIGIDCESVGQNAEFGKCQVSIGMFLVKGLFWSPN